MKFYIFEVGNWFVSKLTTAKNLHNSCVDSKRRYWTVRLPRHPQQFMSYDIEHFRMQTTTNFGECLQLHNLCSSISCWKIAPALVPSLKCKYSLKIRRVCIIKNALSVMKICERCARRDADGLTCTVSGLEWEPIVLDTKRVIGVRRETAAIEKMTRSFHVGDFQLFCASRPS